MPTGSRIPAAHRDHAAAVHRTNVFPGNTCRDTAHRHSGHALGFGDGGLDRVDRVLEVHYHATAKPGRGRVTDSDDLERAILIRLGDDHRHFRGADVESDVGPHEACLSSAGLTSSVFTIT
jgi:hypothetical protein